MKTAAIIHGMPSKEEFFSADNNSESNKHWIPWLQNQLLIREYITWTPEMPKPFLPEYTGWKEEFERYNFNQDSLLVGHSCGAGFLLRWLSENLIKIKKVILVAPWIDPQKRICPNFFDFEFDLKLLERMDVSLFYSDNDELEVNQSVERIKSTFPKIRDRIFHKYGHFCKSDMKTEEFPELLNELIR